MSEANQRLMLTGMGAVRRNHALEHATLHILGRKFKNQSIGGYSDMSGFWIIGEIPTEDIQEAVEEGLQRLRNGEAQLAVHPNCGTNYVVSGMVIGSLAWLGMVNSGGSIRKKLDRLPLIVSLVTVGLILVQPLGPLLQQKVTTDPNPGGLSVYEITRFMRRGINMHRIKTHM